MTRFFTAIAVLSLLTACSVDRGTADSRKVATSSSVDGVSPETFALGTEITPEGAIPRQSAGAAFRRGGEIYLSVDVSSASTDQEIEVQWVDEQGRLVKKQIRQVPEGGRYAVFPSGQTSGWRPGSHRALVIINGRLVSQRQFALM